MYHFIDKLTEKFAHALVRAYPALQEENPVSVIEVTQSKQESFGHYQCSSAMRLAKRLQQNPRAIAEAIVKQMELGGGVEKLEIAGPGFINVTISKEFLSQKTQEMLVAPNVGVEGPSRKLRIIVEFSSPNIAKELHVGHLRSTIIGDSLARVFEFLGHEVIRLNHVGDWGTAFGMLIAYLKKEHPAILTGKEKTDLGHLVLWYKESKKKFDENPAFKKDSQLEVVALQGGDPASLKAWEMICQISREAYQEIYDLLGVKIEERGESFYNPLLQGLVKDLEAKGLITVSDGAKCFFLDQFQNREGQPMPLMIQKSDGGFGYDTTDMAAMRHRVEEVKADRIIVVTDAGQSLHFQMIYQASIKAGYLHPAHTRFDHVPFGLVLGADGKKFRTRSGDTERLIDLLYHAIDKAEEILKERNPAWPEQERKQVAASLGIGAVKYADLSSHRTSDYTFSYDRMLRFEGNTAAFLLYAYVRIQGIIRKVGADLVKIRQSHAIALKHPSEIALGLHLLRFIEALDQVTAELLPNRLTEYLYTLAETFNAFYRDCQVEGSPEMSSRLLLCELTAKVLKQGLHLLGVETVERM